MSYSDVITRKIVFLDKEYSLNVQCITQEVRIHIEIRKYQQNTHKINEHSSITS